MSNKLIAVIFLILSTFTIFSREIAITFDDLPLVKQSQSDQKMQKKIFHDILNILDDFDIKCAGFVVGKKITMEFHEKLLKEFVEKGHTLGNHSYSHPDINKTKIEVYKEDILKGEKVIEPISKGTRYFRYPLLHRGDSDRKKQAIYKFLRERNYHIASVSIDNDDYSFNNPAREAFRNDDQVTLLSIKNQYLDHMKERIKFYEDLSEKKLGREMKHVLLLHLNFSNSLFLKELLNYLRSDGWEFISLEEALEDPVYKLNDDYCGKKGIGWLERINMKGS